ncbi:MAG: hypothetical protein IPM12_09050 [Flavobacteriales bacterium]|nr:hypothetical protein [Flavobacteriales bacterium]
MAAFFISAWWCSASAAHWKACKAVICIANPEATHQEVFISWAEYDAMYPLPSHLT